jgi:hypothetical protein
MSCKWGSRGSDPSKYSRPELEHMAKACGINPDEMSKRQLVEEINAKVQEVKKSELPAQSLWDGSGPFSNYQDFLKHHFARYSHLPFKEKMGLASQLWAQQKQVSGTPPKKKRTERGFADLVRQVGTRRLADYSFSRDGYTGPFSYAYSTQCTDFEYPDCGPYCVPVANSRRDGGYCRSVPMRTLENLKQSSAKFPRQNLE